MSAKPKKCVFCDKYPEVKQRSEVYGGSKYKSGTRQTWWECHCIKCWRCSDHHETEQAVIEDWNEQVAKDREREDVKDKLLYDLEHSAYRDHAGEVKREHALARLLRDVAWIKEQITEMRTESAKGD